MSCISKILEVKGNKDILISNNIAIEGGGVYKDYEYLITFTSFGHRCGYVAISSDHPLYKFHEPQYNFPSLDVHGGVTFFEEPRFEEFMNGHKCTDMWIGFDAAHYNDIEDIEKAEEYFGETKWINFKKNNTEPRYRNKQEHRTYSYMENECKKLIEQLI